jgi:hypothetical protein
MQQLHQIAPSGGYGAAAWYVAINCKMNNESSSKDSFVFDNCQLINPLYELFLATRCRGCVSSGLLE